MGQNQRRWMVVDDDPFIGQMLTVFLTAVSGTHVSCYESPNEALKVFAAEPELFEVIITDLEMPHLNGLELSRCFLAMAPQLKIVLMTGSYSGIERAASEGTGLAGFLYKPFSLDSLQLLLENIGALKHRRVEDKDTVYVEHN